MTSVSAARVAPDPFIGLAEAYTLHAFRSRGVPLRSGPPSSVCAKSLALSMRSHQSGSTPTEPRWAFLSTAATLVTT